MPEPAQSPIEATLGQLARVATALGPAVAPAGLSSLLQDLVGAAREVFGAQACSLALLSDDESELVYVAAAGVGAAEITGVRLPSGQGLAGWVAMSGQPVAVDDLRNDRRFARDVAEGTGYVPQALLAVPVSSPTRLLGVLTVLDRDAARPEAVRDMTLLALFGSQAALALEAMSAVRRIGGVLLTAVGVAARGEGPDLTSALERATADAADAEDDAGADLAELAALFVRLDDADHRTRTLAVRILGEVLAFTGRRSDR